MYASIYCIYCILMYFNVFMYLCIYVLMYLCMYVVGSRRKEASYGV